MIFDFSNTKVIELDRHWEEHSKEPAPRFKRIQPCKVWSRMSKLSGAQLWFLSRTATGLSLYNQACMPRVLPNQIDEGCWRIL